MLEPQGKQRHYRHKEPSLWWTKRVYRRKLKFYAKNKQLPNGKARSKGNVMKFAEEYGIEFITGDQVIEQWEKFKMKSEANP